jgi:hypothetical protein
MICLPFFRLGTGQGWRTARSMAITRLQRVIPGRLQGGEMKDRDICDEQTISCGILHCSEN